MIEIRQKKLTLCVVNSHLYSTDMFIALIKDKPNVSACGFSEGRLFVEIELLEFKTKKDLDFAVRILTLEMERAADLSRRE